LRVQTNKLFSLLSFIILVKISRKIGIASTRQFKPDCFGLYCLPCLISNTRHLSIYYFNHCTVVVKPYHLRSHHAPTKVITVFACGECARLPRSWYAQLSTQKASCCNCRGAFSVFYELTSARGSLRVLSDNRKGTIPSMNIHEITYEYLHFQSNKCIFFFLSLQYHGFETKKTYLQYISFRYDFIIQKVVSSIFLVLWMLL
jgi:hypothetical protein